jgi:hypothetical protein
VKATAADEFRAAVGAVTPLAIRQRVEHDRPPHPRWRTSVSRTTSRF